MTYGSNIGGNGSYAGSILSAAHEDIDSATDIPPQDNSAPLNRRFPVDPGYPTGHAEGSDPSGVGRMLADNKVPLALIGAGIGWLLFSAARKTQTYDRAAHWAEDQAARARSSLSRRYHDLSHRVEEGLHEAGHRIDEAAHDLSDKAASLRDRAKRKLSRVRHSRQVNELSERFAGYGDSAYGFDYEEDEGGRRYRRIVAESEAIAQRARRRAARINRSFWDLVDEHPVSAGLVGLALGAAIGAALPATRTEDELVGKYRDDLLDEALAKGRRTAEKAAHVAKEAASAGADAAAKAADDEAERQGLKAGAL